MEETVHSHTAFLRGINVGGHNRLKMADLREVCESIGFENVRTYIQSGNVLFKTPETNIDSISTELEEAIRDSFDYEVSVMVRTCAELAAIVDQQPFEEPIEDTTKLYVTFLRNEPDEKQIQALDAAQNEAEEFVVDGYNLYSRIQKDKLKPGQFTDVGQVSGIPATRRTWNVVTKVYELAR